MSLLSRFRDFMSPSAPPALRNRPGGLAWLKGLDRGAESLNGCMVTTVSVDGGFWTIDPPLTFIATAPMLAISGRIALPGETATVITVHDDALVPIPDRGITDEEVRDLYAPNVRAKEGQGA